MGNVYVGTSGWAYATWKPRFYPAKLGATKFLSHYAERLNSVEVNYTFGKMVSAETMQKWVDTTPDGFLFAVKAHMQITHRKRLRGTEAVCEQFFGSIEALRKAKKLGPVLFQLPPNFKFDAGRLRGFLATLPPEVRVAFEFRHESWFVEDTYSALRDASVALCLAESEKIVTPNVQTAAFHYVRLRKPRYSATKVAQRVRGLASTGDVFAYFKHEDSPKCPLNAKAVLAEMMSGGKSNA
jgi:uncharacterized protein YecE (DUF72 family)